MRCHFDTAEIVSEVNCPVTGIGPQTGYEQPYGQGSTLGSGIVAQPSAPAFPPPAFPPPAQPTSPPSEPAKRDRGLLFYVFVGIAALALFFLSLLITVLVLN